MVNVLGTGTPFNFSILNCVVSGKTMAGSITITETKAPAGESLKYVNTRYLYPFGTQEEKINSVHTCDVFCD